MKIKYSGILAVCFLVSLVFLMASQGQNPQWKGTIEEEDGVKVIKNPSEPVYGEIEFELEEISQYNLECQINYISTLQNKTLSLTPEPHDSKLEEG